MGMTNNQLELVRAVAESDMARAKYAAIACCAEDDTKKNQMRVARYKSMLGSKPNFVELPQSVQGLLVMEDVSATFQAGRYFVTERERQVLDRIVHMRDAAEQLMQMKIPYLNATMLYGSPGTGKTTFARYAAYTLGVPFAYVNFAGIINSYLGSTSKNLAKIFEFLRTQRCLVVLDEIDCIGLARGGGGDSVGGELARTTISLMQELDTLSNEHILIGATNRYDRLDDALKSRFTVHHEVIVLTYEERVAMITKYLDDVSVPYDLQNIQAYAKHEYDQRKITGDIVQAIADSLISGNQFQMPFKGE